MIRKFKSLRWTMPLLLIFGTQMVSFAQQGPPTGTPPGPGPGGFRPPNISVPIQSDTSRTLGTYFSLATIAKKAPDPKGFIQRWLVLEPIKKDITRNSIFTDNYLRTTFAADNFSDDFTIVPKKGDMVKLGEQELKWHAIDSKLFNFKLHRFSYAMNKPQNGILYWVVTVIDCPKEIKDVRMTAGCNSGGMFWLNGEEAVMVSGDRDMVVDNFSSEKLTLKKGRNVIRGAIINGPGMIDFCVRFLDSKMQPVKGYTISYQ
ncbi:MAG: acetylxylan esterase [Saprospiraceae bacterium]|nr:acetylxylan esterase [Saprospiraceae bacterium]HMS67313.1 hypothetical protein [Saprospiraceae bacterium]